MTVPRRDTVAGAVAVLAAGFAAFQLRHGVVPMLDTTSYWSGVRAFHGGHLFTTTLAPSFSNFDVQEMLQRGGRLPFVDFPVGYPLLAGIVSLALGVRHAMIVVTVVATALMVFIGVAGPRSRSVSTTALAVRCVVMLGVVTLPVYRLTTQGALSEPLFCAAAIWFVAALIEYRDEHRSWVLPALLVAICGLFRFVGAALVLLLVIEMWRCRERLRIVVAGVVVAVGPVLINVIWATAAGGGHRAGWRGLDRRDMNTIARSIGGWFNSRLGDLRLTYFGADRSLAWWVWLVTICWIVVLLVAAVTALAPRRGRVADEATLGLCAAGVLFAALIAGMAGFDSLVIADNRLMLPIGMLTVVSAAWSVREVNTRRVATVVALTAVGWVLLASGVSNWTESFNSRAPSAALDPVVLPNGHRVAVVLTNDADSIHWASGVPAAYLPFAVNSLTGKPVDTQLLYEGLPCELLRHDGLIVIKDSLFGPGDTDALTRLVAQGRLIPVASSLGDAFAATESCDG